MIPIGIRYPSYPALNVRIEVGQNGCVISTLRKWFAVYGPGLCAGWIEESSRDLLLFVSDNVEYCIAAGGQALEHIESIANTLPLRFPNVVS